MPDTPTKRGGKRPNTGGKRKGAGRKSLADQGKTARTETLSLRVEPDIKAWLEANGGSKKHYALLRNAYINALIY
jgi:hypothetical protein